MLFNLTPFIILLPLLGFIAIGLLGRYMSRFAIITTACGTVGVAALLAASDLYSLLSVAPADRSSDVILWRWIDSGSLHIDFGVLNDPLSAVMLLIVTGIGFLIHIYSHGYMEEDPGYWRFFSYLNFFIFAMSLLVAADNFLILLVGWAAVGLASYLLIGFWYERKSAVAAARKAFVVNVIGDVALLIAIFLLFGQFGSVNYTDIFTSAPTALHSNSAFIIATTLLLFVAAAAKSAQIPLYIWLPDAMEGPTPVSALIHAATMVTAGVYLVARANVLFALAPTSLTVVAWIGGITAIFAATIGLVQFDIKRVLAYSTISQIGYMFMAEGVGSYSAGMFHLSTHAYFKALLFLCAGGVIHALHGEQDMRAMGGLRKKLPVTFWTFLIGGLAISAIPPFAGFFSKDEILSSLLQAGMSGKSTSDYILWGLGILTAGLTSFYIFRLIFSVFFGEYRGASFGTEDTAMSPRKAERYFTQLYSRLHDVPWGMGVPLIVLAVLSVIGGWIWSPFSGFLTNQFVTATETVLPASAQYISAGVSLLAALIGIGVAWLMYIRKEPEFAPSRNPVYLLLQHKYYVDEIYNVVLVQPIVFFGRVTYVLLERFLLDGGGWLTGWIVRQISSVLGLFENGFVRSYGLLFLFGATIIVLFFTVHP